MIELADRRVVSVMSASLLYRENKKTLQFRELLTHYDHEIIELDEGVFKASGTNVKTIILVLNK